MTKKFLEIMEHRKVEYNLFKPVVKRRAYKRRLSDHFLHVEEMKQVIEK